VEGGCERPHGTVIESAGATATDQLAGHVFAPRPPWVR
jgi:hypothetical protein